MLCARSCSNPNSSPFVLLWPTGWLYVRDVDHTCLLYHITPVCHTWMDYRPSFARDLQTKGTKKTCCMVASLQLVQVQTKSITMLIFQIVTPQSQNISIDPHFWHENWSEEKGEQIVMDCKAKWSLTSFLDQDHIIYCALCFVTY